MKTKKHMKAHIEIKHRKKSAKNEVVKLGRDEDNIFKCNNFKEKFEDKVVSKSSHRNKAQ